MRRLLTVLGSMALVLVLGACSQAPLFAMDGSYVVTIVVTDSNSATVGDTALFLLEVVETEGQVDATLDETIDLTGTRSGNSVVLEGNGMGTEVWSFDLTWISETTFEATGRLEDGPDYADFDGSGFSSVHLPVP